MTDHTVPAWLSTEAWKEIPGFPGHYASIHGQIARIRDGHVKNLGQGRNTSGHKVVNLRDQEGKARRLYVHRVILTTFKGEPAKGMVCCHHDDDPANNRLDNLRWDTPKGNSRDRTRNSSIGRVTKHQPIQIPAAWDSEHQTLAEHHNNLILQADQLRHQRVAILNELDKLSKTLKNLE